MPLSREVTVRCSKEEREAWHAYAVSHNVSLSELIRTMCNNVSGVYDPPRLEVFTDRELPQYTQDFHAERVRRRRRTLKANSNKGKGLLVLIAMVGALASADANFFLGDLRTHAAHTAYAVQRLHP